MNEPALLPHLFRTEYKKIVAVLCKRFGIDQMELAEDIAGETFLSASEVWGLKGLPDNPTAWLYAVAKNKTNDYFRHRAVFAKNILPQIKSEEDSPGMEIDLSHKNIQDSQLAMIFAVCHPTISTEAQIGLALHILCGFGVTEIANAFLTSKEAVYKRLQRAKDKLKKDRISIEPPTPAAIDERLETVLRTLYLLFNEGYYSTSQDTSIRTEFCIEAMQLNQMLLDNDLSNTETVNALFSLMCFQASRLAARTSEKGETILYDDQDISLWDQLLIEKGKYYLNQALKGNRLSKYHLEATIAFWHTNPEDTKEKWENILQLYNQLLIIEYSPIIALNRTYALAKANGKQEALREAEKIGLVHYHLYHSLLGHLHTGLDHVKALEHYQIAFWLAPSDAERKSIARSMAKLTETTHIS
ncbi:MAG: sigma-70 family RNA polymerase sigma factor [Bacteroidota bacterium]